jgi:hypothetical protein
MTRVYLRLLQVAALIGLTLSVIGWAAVSVTRVVHLLDGTARIPGPLDKALFVLDGMKEAAVPLFLSAILLVVCEIALRLVPRRTTRDAP